MTYRSWTMAAAVALAAMMGGVTQADVYNMPAGQTSLQFVTVGNPGNAADPATGSLYGTVGYTYNIGKYDVTVGQYCQFLDAVAATDTYGLYTLNMNGGMPTVAITQTGSPGSYSYSVTGGHNGTNSAGVNFPIWDVSWGNAARFCNWLQNGQPTGAEGPGTTETGAYTLNGAVTQSALMAITRNAGAIDFIPSENEWYKAAYYKGGSTNAGYWTYPTQNNTAPINTLPDTGNHANFWDYYDTGNGGYTDPTNYWRPWWGHLRILLGRTARLIWAAMSSSGMRRQIGSSRGLRGGSWHGLSDSLASSFRDNNSPTYASYYIGFRVASVPTGWFLSPVALRWPYAVRLPL